MKFGLHFQSFSGSQSPAQRYRDTLEQAVYAEALGFESVWPVEQHFNQLQSALPCPTLLLAAIASRTTSLRLGTAIVQLPLAPSPTRCASRRRWRRSTCSAKAGSNSASAAAHNLDTSPASASPSPRAGTAWSRHSPICRSPSPATGSPSTAASST